MVFAVEVLDDDAADEGVRDLLTCDGGDAGESAGWVVEDGWLVLAETPEIARGVVDDTAEGSLAEDEDFRRWTGEVGDAGVLTMYAAPEAPRVLAEAFEGFLGSGMPSAYTDETSGSELEAGRAGRGVRGLRGHGSGAALRGRCGGDRGRGRCAGRGRDSR